MRLKPQNRLSLLRISCIKMEIIVSNCSRCDRGTNRLIDATYPIANGDGDVSLRISLFFWVSLIPERRHATLLSVTYALRIIHYTSGAYRETTQWERALWRNIERQSQRSSARNHKTAPTDLSSEKQTAARKVIPHTHLAGSQSMKDECASTHPAPYIPRRLRRALAFTPSTYSNEKMSENVQVVIWNRSVVAMEP